jgi:ParB family chromosome partitioning protein
MPAAMRRGSVLIKDVWVSPSRRPINQSCVSRLAESIRELGLMTPIIVRVADKVIDPVEGEISDVTALVTGRHRLEAMRSLGIDRIDCFFADFDELHAELAEIDENLMRGNLTPAQEANSVARRKAIYEILHPDTKAGTAGAKARWDANDNLSFASATADATGVDKRSIERAAARGNALRGDLKAIEGTSLDKGVELDALAKMTADERASVIERAKAGEKVSARPPKPAKLAPEPKNHFESREDWMSYMMRGWNRAPAEWREAFFERVDGTIFDQSAMGEAANG